MTIRTLRRVILVAGAVVLVAAGCTTGEDGEAAAAGDGPGVTVLGGGEEYVATIRRTEGGVPHITADDLENVAFGQGWASAEDRACDLADQVLKVNGERARWLGPGEDDENIDSDVAWRTIGIREIAEEDWANATEETVDVITAYTEGWNGHLAEVGSDGLTDWCAGAEWVRPLEPVDVYAYGRSIALNASSTVLASAIPEAIPPGVDEAAEEPTGDEIALGPVATPGAFEPVAASNGWAIGEDRAAAGGGMLVANPHFPWEGQLRFWEVHLTVPDEIDMYGAQLSGLPGLAIGFNDDVAWTHTVSAGNRFTAYSLDLVDGDPTSYVFGEEQREMTPVEHSIEVLDEGGELSEVERTTWRSQYGPMIDFPGVGWSDSTAITFRDANIDNDEFIDQYVEMVQVEDLDELIALHEEYNGVPLFNTVATSSDGRAWYADTSATPALSDEALAAYETSLETDLLAAGAADSGAVLLDGSNPLFDWVALEGARDPGLVPYADQPVVERSDYLFNANDSFWMPHATELLEGDYSRLHGEQRTPRSPRTRENATVLDDTGPDGAAGEDGSFDLDELADAALANRGFTARALLDDVVARCDGAAPVSVDELPAPEPEEGETPEDLPGGLPAGEVDVAPACEVLAGWDGVYDLDRAGPPIFREMISRFERDDLGDAGPLWAEPFDPAQPLATPSGLAPAPADGADPVLSALARAVQVLEAAEIDLDATLGELQQAERDGTSVPIHGGTGIDGTTNIVGWGTGWATADPALAALDRTRIAPDSQISEVTDGETTTVGYRINNGTSFLMAVALTPDGPEAKSFLTYANTADRSNPDYLEATERFSEKNWREVLLDPEEIADAATSTTEVRG